MKKENYTAGREFTGKVGAGVPPFEVGWLVWGTVYTEKHRAPPLGFSGAFMRGSIGEALQLPFNSLFTDTRELSPTGDEKDHTIVHFQLHSIPPAATTVYMEKPHYMCLCRRLHRTVRLNPPPSAKDFL